MENSIVIDLQKEILTPNCDILNALRKAHVIASKLNLTEFDRWIQMELNGYNDKSDIPNYRHIHGTLKALNPYYGWIPATIANDELENALCERKIYDSISALIELYNKDKSGFVQFSITGTALEEINKMFNFPIKTQYAFFISVHKIKEIIEKIKDCLLQWTITLENAGIQGNNLVFSDNEKDKAKSIPYTINNYYGNTNVVNAPIYNSQIVTGNNVSSFSYDNCHELIEEIKTLINDIEVSNDNLQTINELMEDIEDKISKKKKPAIIKSALCGLKEFLISIGSSLVANMIETKINGLLP